MTIAQVRDALADAVDGIDRLRARPYVGDQVNPPEAIVVFRGVEYDLAMGRGADQHNYVIQVLFPRDAERQSQEALDLLCEPSGATSIKTVIENAAPLAALVDYARVRTASGVQVATVGASEYLMIEFEVEVVV